jgi:hypothetical protein
MINIPQAGFRPGPFAVAIGISRTTLYELPADLQPHSVRIGSARIIIEKPDEYLRRLATIQAEGVK